MCTLCSPLGALTHQVKDYKPMKEHFDKFNEIKVEVSKMGALPYFDVNAETTLQMDALKKGLAAYLIQKDKVICFASCSLTKTEQNYQNLEREALGMIWGMEKFHYFLYGMEFTLKTDLKPLVSIYKKHMIDISPRVQRLTVRSFPYQPFKVAYNKEAQIPIANALSRATPWIQRTTSNFQSYHNPSFNELCFSEELFHHFSLELERAHNKMRSSLGSNVILTLAFLVKKATANISS